MSTALHLLSIARKAGKLEVGEEPAGAAARARQARLLVVARDAADNTYRRVRHFAEQGNCTWVSTPYSKSELGAAVGRTSCALLAVTDMGLAAAVVRALAQEDPEKFTPTMELLDQKAEKALRRQREKRQHEKNLKTGKYRRKQAAKASEEAEKSAPRSAPKLTAKSAEHAAGKSAVRRGQKRKKSGRSNPYEHWDSPSRKSPRPQSGKGKKTSAVSPRRYRGA